MNLPIQPTPAATEDITDLYYYFLEQSPNLAERFLECLDKTYEMLTQMPELGQLYRFRDTTMRDARIRKIKKFSNYLIFYRIETDHIKILRVIHGATDYMNSFGAELPEEEETMQVNS